MVETYKKGFCDAARGESSLATSLEITVQPILLAVNESRVLRGEDYSRFLHAEAIQRTGEDARPPGPEENAGD